MNDKSRKARGSRDKGKRFEREVASALHDLLGIKFARDLSQYQRSDQGDLLADCPDFPFLIECKRRASGGFENAWWKQAHSAAVGASKMPAVVYRFDHQETRVRVQIRAVMECLTRGKYSAEDSHFADITLEGFAYLCREGMQ